MTVNLKDDSQLKAACESALQQSRLQPRYLRWVERLTAFLKNVRDATHEEFTSEAFQHELWDNQAVSSTGMGSVDISAVAKNHDVAQYLWELKSAYPSLDSVQQEVLINESWDQLLRMIEPLIKRRPLLKICRLFAALCRVNFTTITNFRKLHELALAMGFNGKFGQGQVQQRQIMERLNSVLGHPGIELSQAWVERMTLPWLLYVNHVQKQELEATEVTDLVTGEEQLNPLPPDRRRRGMLAIGGSTSTIRTMIEFAREGCKREDFREHLRSISPTHATTTLNTQMNALIAEWGVLRAEGDNLLLTSRGESFLESGDPDEVADWLLTRILGFDNILSLLSESPLSVKALTAELQKVNAGWTSNFVPGSLINWVRGLQLVDIAADKALHLTERGESWAARIHWTPGILTAEVSLDPQGIPIEKKDGYRGVINRPELSQIIESFDPEISFRPELIGQLDAGLWGHHRRHFAVPDWFERGRQNGTRTRLCVGAMA